MVLQNVCESKSLSEVFCQHFEREFYAFNQCQQTFVHSATTTIDTRDCENVETKCHYDKIAIIYTFKETLRAEHRHILQYIVAHTSNESETHQHIATVDIETFKKKIGKIANIDEFSLITRLAYRNAG
ncbi:hypothetical protein AB6A40_009350 [Gnathostoma spinigerum]|uniref:Uncharacterized protein n=1 Tax=Gnathostoma spinigerum TaxID=75299 RepID=A0ABD6ES25_9BILA